MISIKNSYADCSKCTLLDAPSCILETNCEDDLSKVDVIFIAENPSKDEVEKQKPLIGKTGQIFRKNFKKTKLDKFNYLITNTVLCETTDDNGTPDDETINLCKENCRLRSERRRITTFSPFVIGIMEMRRSNFSKPVSNVIFPSCGFKCSSVCKSAMTLILVTTC